MQRLFARTRRGGGLRMKPNTRIKMVLAIVAAELAVVVWIVVGWNLMFRPLP